MSLDDFYINRITQKKKGNMKIYDQTLIDLFHRPVTWSEVKNLERNEQMKLCIELERRIKMHESKYDFGKLARAIQNSRSGVGLCAITNFKCAFCDVEEIWGNTNTPNICKKCAEEMATNMILNGSKIEKE